MLSVDCQAIVAQCTPRGSGALALIRISGADAVRVATQISKLADNSQLIDQPTHTIHYGQIVDDQNNSIDHVLFLLMRGPKTFTGQDTVEITCHNNPFIVEQIIAQAITHGARMAQNGEFTRRALLNNKIDLLQAEAINELIHANTNQSLKQSLAQLQGSFSHWLQVIEKNIVKALAFTESSFEFIDEELTFNNQIAEIIEQTLVNIKKIKQSFDKQQHIRQGIHIAIIGSVNAGKSSLFNALLAQERAIVTNIAGTTRDVIEAGLYKNGNYWTLIDTAGIRQTEDTIEKEGIKRSFEQAHLADIIILVFDGSRTITAAESAVYNDFLAQYNHKIIRVLNKADLATETTPSTVVKVSAKNGTGITELEQAIQHAINKLFADAESPFLLNQRHFNLILNLERQLTTAMAMLTENVHYELLSYHLQEALTDLSELTGKTISEQGMDAVFREFCVGK